MPGTLDYSALANALSPLTWHETEAGNLDTTEGYRIRITRDGYTPWSVATAPDGTVLGSQSGELGIERLKRWCERHFEAAKNSGVGLESTAAKQVSNAVDGKDERARVGIASRSWSPFSITAENAQREQAAPACSPTGPTPDPSNDHSPQQPTQQELL